MNQLPQDKRLGMIKSHITTPRMIRWHGLLKASGVDEDAVRMFLWAERDWK